MIIDQLPLLGGDVQGTDEFPIERGTTTYKATLEQIFATVYSAIEPNFAGAYDSTETYAVGDYVVHAHKLYICTTEITTAEAWTAAHWTQVDVAGELSAIYSGKQDTLISGTNIKTVGGQSLLGSGNIDAGGDVTADMLGIVITGARPSMAVSPGQYVIVRESTITGITDGLYINSSSGDLSPSTDVTAADLTPVSGGGLNKLWDYVEKTLYTNIPPVAPVTIGAHQYGSYKTAVPMNMEKIPIQRYMGGGLMTDFTETNGCFDFTIFNPSDNAITPTFIWFYLI